jgi:hypothetical protein
MLDQAAVPESSVQEVDLAVLLDFDGRALRIDWSHRGYVDGLALQFDSSLPAEWDFVEERRGGNWLPLLGSSPLRGEIVWHQSSLEACETAFAVTMVHPERKRFTIALGEVIDGVPRYSPESIIVFFGQGAGGAYLASHTSSITSVSMTVD